MIEHLKSRIKVRDLGEVIDTGSRRRDIPDGTEPTLKSRRRWWRDRGAEPHPWICPRLI